MAREPVDGLSCGYNLTGILVAGGAKLTLTGSDVTGAAPRTINGCQYGLGILVGIPESGDRTPFMGPLVVRVGGCWFVAG